ncbi:L-glyceraldehyde 3-phosphate reductase [Paludicola sp. MB14-C6]|uniref:L-glyceraldehyde 3-phosphate reductase n=1 Tax=Paludihabitans sp. MB14-C6 TaxID=3070656 RepID=UPI0027DB2CB8|nr:L-glyceraldehyde 3-phosphate reductase [Paludicola sp. MB14-C6]WMJ22227.1 L-glyceraldehyde 3-phosphate reductase [Paludicola sp. MB14-C6]
MNYIADNKRYENMKYRKCGNSGLVLPLISLGMWQNFGSNRPYDNSKAMLLRAFDLGINHFDLANNYGPVPGSAEETMGKVLKESLKPYRDELIISSKAGYEMWSGPYGNGSSRKYLMASLDQSLQRMGLDYVDIFYSHRFDENTPLEETMGALADIVKQGKALYVGISSYDHEKTQQASDIIKKMSVPLLIHQPSYSLLNRWIEPNLQDVLEKEGMGSIAFCPLSQGVLTSRYLNGIAEGSRATFQNSSLSCSEVTEEKRQQLIRLNEIAALRGQTLAQMALAWVLRDGKVTSALIGSSRVEQIEENVKAIDNLEFTKEELNEIDACYNAIIK